MSGISNLLLSVRCCRLVLNSPCAWLMSGWGPTPVFPIIGHFLAQWVGSPHLKQPSLFGALGCDNLACLAFKAISFASVLPPKHKQTLWYSWRGEEAVDCQTDRLAREWQTDRPRIGALSSTWSLITRWFIMRPSLARTQPCASLLWENSTNAYLSRAMQFTCT